jgi:hypothetical protein
MPQQIPRGCGLLAGGFGHLSVRGFRLGIPLENETHVSRMEGIRRLRRAGHRENNENQQKKRYPAHQGFS